MDHDLSDYQFSSFKVLARKARFAEIGQDVAGMFSRIAREEHSCDDPVTFNAALVDRLADDYFDRVRRFKWLNGFGLDERINPPKMAALMAESVKKIDGGSRLFSVPEKLQGKAFEHLAFLNYIYALICSTLFIRITSVPLIHERDLFICLDQHNVATEWLCWSMHNFALAFGEIQDGLGE